MLSLPLRLNCYGFDYMNHRLDLHHLRLNLVAFCFLSLVIFSRIMSSRSQPQPSIRLTSRILKIAKSYNVQDVPEGFTANLSSTLEKLYAWEKKLYKEVKVSINSVS